MENKVKSIHEARAIFDLLGIKDVTKDWQSKQGTQVFELPFKTMYYNGHAETNRFSIYKSGYVRKMVVYGKNNASMSCYQLNKVRKKEYFVKDYKYNFDTNESKWTGKYRKQHSNERIMIDTHEDRYVYLCNYILKNYYRNGKMNLVGKYTMKRIAKVHNDWHKMNTANDQLPFTDEGKRYDDELCVNDIKVIINGHRYNLS